MSNLLESEGEITNMCGFADEFFQPTVETMAMLYKSSLHHVDLLFDKICKTTNIEDRVVRTELEQRSCQISKFKEIKSDIQYILDELTKLHVYASDINVSDYFEIFGIFLKKLLKTWDKFFCAVFRIRFKTCNNKRLKRCYKLADIETKSIKRKILKLQQLIDPLLQTCGVRREEKIRECVMDSMHIFRVKASRFDIKCSKEEERLSTHRTSLLRTK